MGKIRLKSNECYLTCKECRNEYDMAALSLRAKQKGLFVLNCPKCGKKVGTMGVNNE